MLHQKFTTETPLPFPGSMGYLRGTAQKVRVLRRELPSVACSRCTVQLYRKDQSTGWQWQPVEGASGVTTVPEGDLYATEREAMFCGKPPRADRRRSVR